VTFRNGTPKGIAYIEYEDEVRFIKAACILFSFRAQILSLLLEYSSLDSKLLIGVFPGSLIMLCSYLH